VNESDYRAVLAERVKAARRRKFKTVDAARQAADVARGTWEKAEKGLPIKDFSLAAIEKALEWEEGYAQAILDGHDPGLSGLGAALGITEEPRPRPQLGGLDAYLASIEDRLDALESRMAIQEHPLWREQMAQKVFNELHSENQRRSRREREMSAVPDSVGDLVAADEQDQSISGEQEESDTP
jgi:hypothetical protein